MISSGTIVPTAGAFGPLTTSLCEKRGLILATRKPSIKKGCFLFRKFIRFGIKIDRNRRLELPQSHDLGKDFEKGC